MFLLDDKNIAFLVSMRMLTRTKVETLNMIFLKQKKSTNKTVMSFC